MHCCTVVSLNLKNISVSGTVSACEKDIFLLRILEGKSQKIYTIYMYAFIVITTLKLKNLRVVNKNGSND